MSALISSVNFTQIFLENTPLIDTRAPIEFAQGAFPTAQNLPLMSDDERHQIGICYKKHGQARAIELGKKLVQGSVKNQRVAAWADFAKNHSNGALYCFRGGLRSQISQTWINEAIGVDYPRIEGGYKALRRFLLVEMTRIMAQMSLLVIGGKTGCGKTLLLQKIAQKIDLEGLANHRGSAFGNTTSAQPTQINFENSLVIELLKLQSHPRLLFEDEGANIGTVHIPGCVKTKTERAPLAILKVDFSERMRVSIDAYAIEMYQNFIEQDAQNGFANFANYWLSSLAKIRKRLGLVRYQQLEKILKSALNLLQNQNSFDGFYPLIETLLLDYYDPMYAYQIQKKSDRIVFEGDVTAMREYLHHQLIG